MSAHVQLTENRRGVSAVEFAIVLPVIVLLFLGAMEVGRVVMVQHALQEAAHAGCRVYMSGESTADDARKVIDSSLKEAGINGYNIDFSPAKDEVTDFLEPMTVSVTVPYSSVAWTSSRFMGNRNMTASATMPSDSGEVVEIPKNLNIGGGGSGGNNTYKDRE